MDALKNLKILLIDDDESIRVSMNYFLKRKTAFFKAVENSEQGLEAIQKVGPIDVIIADYHLPGMDGLSFLEAARKRYPDVLTIVITADCNHAIALKAAHLGIHKLMQKPFTAKEMILALGSFCVTD